MLTRNLFLDTNIMADYILPSRRNTYACSVELMDKVKKDDFKGWSADYALSEILGILKMELEAKNRKSYIDRETLTFFEISKLVQIINTFRTTPHFEVFQPDPISQADMFEKVKSVCVQAKDALVLLSALSLHKKYVDTVLVTRDDRLLIRGKKMIRTAHPIELVGTCPVTCTSRSNCRHKR